MSKPAALLPFPQLLFPRLRKALNRLASTIWCDPVPLQVERTKSAESLSWEEAQKARLSPVEIPSTWKAPGFSTTWFRVRLPEGYVLRPGDHLHWDDNAEATAWHKGEPLFGLDATHRQWPWPAGARELWLESIFCQSGIWHAAAKGIGPAGSLLAQARLVRKDEATWQAYFDLEVLADWLEEEIRRALPQEAEQLLAGYRTWPEMDSASSTFLPDGVGTGVANRWRPGLDRLAPLLRGVMRDLEEAITLYHRAGVAALRRRLKEIYARLRESGLISRVTLTGHAHIDLVWLWPEATGEQKAVRTFATVESLMARYPEFYFGYSQPASYEAVRRRNPGLMRRVQRRIKEGRWEVTGAMYVESDTLMACGEALLRSFTLGQEQFQKLQGSPSPVLWLPDAFGFSGCLPRLMRMTDTEYFFTNKLMWNMIHRFPHTSFVWRGNDGAEVVAHVSGATGYNNPARPRNLRLESEANRQADVHAEFLLPAGWGDGGGGPTADIIERVRRQRDLRNQPAASWGRIDEFFRRLEEVRDALPVWCGEIYLEAHRGTYTTQGAMKAAYRRLERALQVQEAAHCATGAGPIDRKAWERLVFAQFHDCLPGSSIHEVYEATLPELDRLAEGARAAARQVLGGKKRGNVFNPLPLPLPITTPAGTKILPPLASSPSSGAVIPPARQTRSNVLENGFVRAEFDRHGMLTQLSVSDVALLAGEPRLVAYRDVPYDLEAWEIDRAALDAPMLLQPLSGFKKRRGDGWCGVSKNWRLGESRLEVLWKLRDGMRALEMELTMDWREPECLLRLEVPTPFRGKTALFGGPFGADWRLQQPGDPRQSAQWEVPANRWALASDDGRQAGAFLVTEAKYGFSARDGVLGVSLLKSAKTTVTTAFPASFRVAGDAPRPVFSDLGRQVIRVGLGGVGAETPREGYPAAVAEILFAEPVREVGGDAEIIFPQISGMPSLIPAWCQPLHDGGWVLRLHETFGRGGQVAIQPPAGWVASIMEKANPGKDDRVLRPDGMIEIGPFAIVSLHFQRA